MDTIVRWRHNNKRHKILKLVVISSFSLLAIAVSSVVYTAHKLELTSTQPSTSMTAGVVGSISSAQPIDISGVTIENLLKYTNQNRNANSVAPLALNTNLNSSAKTKCGDMVTRNYWSHNDPQGQEPWRFIKATGYSYSKAGENQAYGYHTSADVVSGWMNSPEHKANILNSQFKEVGFGICESENFVGHGHTIIVVQHFGTPPAVATTPTATPTPKPYVPPVCTKTPIPFKTVYQNVSYLNAGETQSYGGIDGWVQKCTSDSTGYKPQDITSPPYDRTTYVGTRVPPSSPN